MRSTEQHPTKRPRWLRAGARRVLADVSPLIESRDFRRLFWGRAISLLGTQATEIALLVQAKQLTHSPIAVGLLGVAEIAPLVIFGLYGGTLADRYDRRTVALLADAGLALAVLGLALDAAQSHPLIWPLYAGAAAIMALAALQRPSLDAAVPRILPSRQLAAGAALLSLASNTSVIFGSAAGGIVIADFGPRVVFAADAATYIASLLLLRAMSPLPTRRSDDGAPGTSSSHSILDGLTYVRTRQELIGSYLVDLLAMIFAFPQSLFPFIATQLHANWALGLMFSATAIGAVTASATSGWTTRVTRHGRAIALSAAAWGAAIAGFGLAGSIPLALAALIVAGAADMLSGVFRDTLWNQTIPDNLRGRVAGIELLSYGLGPSAGQIRAGGVASAVSARFSLWSGGALCVLATGVVCVLLPRFTSYDAGAVEDRR